MIINEHTLVHAADAGNGYHGTCQHCGAPLVTDLGYCSWEGLKCIDREIELYQHIPKDIRSYANWRGLRWDNKRKIFTKPFSNEEYTIDVLNNIVTVLKNTKVSEL